MKIRATAHSVILLAIIVSSTANAGQTESNQSTIINLPSSPIVNTYTKSANETLLSCKTNSTAYQQINTIQISNAKQDKLLPTSLEYLNDTVKTSYNTMRNGVIRHVTMQVALSLLNFNVDGFAVENIASYVSDGTKPYLPFEFANGVKITTVSPKGGTVVYRTEMPITKNHSSALALSIAGKTSATTTICNDMKLVDDLLGRDIVIQYDYYDSNGVFFNSFTING